MKPTPERLKLDSYPSQVTIPARFSDVDMFRHLNNVAIGGFYEEVRFALIGEMRELLGRERGGRMVVVNVDTAFIAEGRYPGQVTIGTGLVSRSKRSFVIGQALFQDGRCFSAADTTIVYLEGSATADLPDDLDATFERLRLPGVA